MEYLGAGGDSTLADIGDILWGLAVGSLIFSVAITSYAATLSTQINASDIANFTTQANTQDLNSATNQFESGLSNQQNAGPIEVASLIFYSGNFFVSLFLNFIFAVPRLVGLILTIFLYFTGFSSSLILSVSGLMNFIFSATYAIVVIGFLLGIRSGRTDI